MTTGRKRFYGALALILAVFFAFGARSYSERVADERGSSYLAPSVGGLFQAKQKTWAERVLELTITNIEGLNSLSADFEFESNYFGEKRTGRGRYEELSIRRARGVSALPPLESNRFLVRATLDPEDENAPPVENGETEDGLFEIVCDADRRTWWRFISLDGARSLLRLSIEDLENSLVQLNEAETRALNANGITRSCGMSGMPGLGGLAGVLKRLAASYDFNPEPEIVSSERGARFLKLHGEAKDVFWRRVALNAGMSELSDALKECVPASVDVYCGEDWAFPYKIAYYSAATSNGVKRPLFEVTYTNVVRNADVKPTRFQYVQPQITSDRYDTEYLEELISVPSLYED